MNPLIEVDTSGACFICSRSTNCEGAEESPPNSTVTGSKCLFRLPVADFLNKVPLPSVSPSSAQALAKEFINLALVFCKDCATLVNEGLKLQIEREIAEMEVGMCLRVISDLAKAGDLLAAEEMASGSNDDPDGPNLADVLRKEILEKLAPQLEYSFRPTGLLKQVSDADIEKMGGSKIMVTGGKATPYEPVKVEQLPSIEKKVEKVGTPLAPQRKKGKGKVRPLPKSGNEKPWPCTQCGRDFSSQPNLECHQYAEHMMTMLEDEDVPEGVSEENITAALEKIRNKARKMVVKGGGHRFQCYVCKIQLRSPALLQCHLLTTHLREVVQEAGTIKSVEKAMKGMAI